MNDEYPVPAPLGLVSTTPDCIALPPFQHASTSTQTPHRSPDSEGSRIRSCLRLLDVRVAVPAAARELQRSSKVPPSRLHGQTVINMRSETRIRRRSTTRTSAQILPSRNCFSSSQRHRGYSVRLSVHSPGNRAIVAGRAFSKPRHRGSRNCLVDLVMDLSTTIISCQFDEIGRRHTVELLVNASKPSVGPSILPRLDVRRA